MRSDILPMDIQQLSTMVRDLVLQQDKVVVPGLGVFCAELVPASFSDRGYTLNPPYRKLSFEAEGPSAVPRQEDSRYLVKAEAAELQQCIASLRSELQSSKCVELPLLGKLRLTTSGEMYFIADPDLDIYPDAFGLHPVSMKNHDPQISDAALSALDIDTPMTEPTPQSDAPQPEALKPVFTQSAPHPQTAQPAENAPISESAAPAPQAPDDSAPQAPAPQPATEAAAIEQPASPAPEASPHTPATEQPAAEQPAGPAPEAPKRVDEPAVEPQAPAEAPQTSIPEENTMQEDTAKKKHPALKVIGIVILVLMLAMIAFRLLALIAPDFIDSILYTEEELRLLGK